MRSVWIGLRSHVQHTLTKRYFFFFFSFQILHIAVNACIDILQYERILYTTWIIRDFFFHRRVLHPHFHRIIIIYRLFRTYDIIIVLPIPIHITLTPKISSASCYCWIAKLIHPFNKTKSQPYSSQYLYVHTYM